MKSIFKYYRVYQNQTAITEVSVNNFTQLKPFEFGRIYALPRESELFREYTDRATAMEQAKAGALVHIQSMILNVERGITKLIAYRNEHHDDLNINLLESNIRKFKLQMYIK